MVSLFFFLSISSTTLAIKIHKLSPIFGLILLSLCCRFHISAVEYCYLLYYRERFYDKIGPGSTCIHVLAETSFPILSSSWFTFRY
ncbi:uncharacterized protein BX664DRAFT_341604 [Halteromyces radiatus]|uniref:uncharacterized protein n=1 Tax=Halteromyces radiatus TaxID=101107 RepID=UPI0022205006|nr:uncharacterized protein BX664DRAFT_341604 [Halteromyces radiatus]KAI8079849.1 hypothetical protein BX664DRAFT_341604 [Halteromyces radiatus]